MSEEVVQKIEPVIPARAKAAKIISIVIFSLIMAALVLVIITDIAIFSRQIMAFIGGCLAAILVFIFGFILLVLSMILIFGFYLVEDRGFWPLQWAHDAFYDQMKDAAMTAEQVQIITTIRIIVLVICVICFIGSIVCLSLAKSAAKKNPEIKQKLTKPFGILTLIFSILGVLAALAVLLLFKNL